VTPGRPANVGANTSWSPEASVIRLRPCSISGKSVIRSRHRPRVCALNDARPAAWSWLGERPGQALARRDVGPRGFDQLGASDHQSTGLRPPGRLLAAEQGQVRPDLGREMPQAADRRQLRGRVDQDRRPRTTRSMATAHPPVPYAASLRVSWASSDPEAVWSSWRSTNLPVAEAMASSTSAGISKPPIAANAVAAFTHDQRRSWRRGRPARHRDRYAPVTNGQRSRGSAVRTRSPL